MTSRHAGRWALALWLLLVAAALACEVAVDIIPPTPRPVVVTTTGDWYEIYFTAPTCPPEEERIGGVDELIAADLAQAQRSVDVAAFDLSAEPIVEALIFLERRGVPVRIVTDDENEDQSSIRRLRRNGLSVITDDRSGLMHNKFIVIDDGAVWTGSLNYTSNGAYCNNNNAVRFESPELAANYRAEMDEMVDGRAFGTTSPDLTPYPRLVINETEIETHFASEGETAAAVAAVIAAADSEILFMAFSFTAPTIGDAMLAEAAAGVQVRGVFETTGSELPFSYFGAMSMSGLPNLQVRQDGNRRLMHHKVIIVDRETVILGSYNFSESAETRNDENLLIIHDPVFASYFVEEFDTVWNEAAGGVGAAPSGFAAMMP